MNPFRCAGVIGFGLYSLPGYYPFGVAYSPRVPPYVGSVRLAWPK